MNRTMQQTQNPGLRANKSLMDLPPHCSHVRKGSKREVSNMVAQSGYRRLEERLLSYVWRVQTYWRAVGGVGRAGACPTSSTSLTCPQEELGDASHNNPPLCSEVREPCGPLPRVCTCGPIVQAIKVAEMRVAWCKTCTGACLIHHGTRRSWPERTPPSSSRPPGHEPLPV